MWVLGERFLFFFYVIGVMIMVVWRGLCLLSVRSWRVLLKVVELFMFGWMSGFKLVKWLFYML